MYWPFAVRWLGAIVWGWTLNLDHQIVSASLPLRGWECITNGHISVSPTENSPPFSLSSLCPGHWSAATDWAMPGRAERRKQLIRTFLLSAPADEWQLWFSNLTAKSKNWASPSTKDFLKCVAFLPSSTKQVLCQIQVRFFGILFMYNIKYSSVIPVKS